MARILQLGAIPRSASRRQVWKIPLLAFLTTWIVVILAMVATDLVPSAPPPEVNSDVPSGFWALDPNVTRANLSEGFFQAWYRWDTVRYIDIAVGRGYWYVPDEVSTVAFFPVYPMLIRGLRPVVQNPIAAGLLISSVSYLLSLVLFHHLAIDLLNRQDANRALFYLALFPSAVFFVAAYTESLFLLFSLTAVVAARQASRINGNAYPWWIVAVLACLLASATRFQGVFVGVIVVGEALRAYGWTLNVTRPRESVSTLFQTARSLWKLAALFCLLPGGLALYMLYLWHQFGDPLLFVHVIQTGWNRENLGVVAVLVSEVETLMSGNPTTASGLVLLGWLGIVVLLAGLAGTIPVWRRLGWHYALYSLVSLLVPAWSTTHSLVRYALVLFPLFLVLAPAGRTRGVDRGIVAVFMLGLAIHAALFFKWFFIG